MKDDDQKIVWDASDECIVGLVGTKMRGGKPDFTVTRVRTDRCEKNYLVLQWETVSAGFGELVFKKIDDCLVCIDNEAMSKRFIKDVFNKLVDDMEMPGSYPKDK